MYFQFAIDEIEGAFTVTKALESARLEHPERSKNGRQWETEKERTSSSPQG